MNKHYNQLGEIFLEKTNPLTPAERERSKSKPSFISGKVGLSAERAIADLRAEAPRRAVPPGTTPTTKAQGQEAMAADTDHPADRGKRKSVNSWTVYRHMGKLIAEIAERLTPEQAATRKEAGTEARKRTNTGTYREQVKATRKARIEAITPRPQREAT